MLQDLKQRRMLLKATRKSLERRVAAYSEGHAKTVPFFYSIKGADGEPGIPVEHADSNADLTFSNNKTFSGNAQLDENAPFVLTEVGATLRIIPTFSASASLANKERGLGDGIFQSVQTNISSSASQEYKPSVSLGLIDASSGRYLFQTEVNDAANQRETSTHLLPGALFDLFRYYEINTPEEGDVRVGHGALGGWVLPQETLFPAAGAIRAVVQSSWVPSSLLARANDITSLQLRVYITLAGYKVVG